jgi:phage terminase large subunit
MQEVKLTNVFRRTGDALLAALNGTGPRLIINQGGQGSSKTYSTLQVIYNYLLNAPTTRATFCSYALPHLKQGVCSDFDRIIDSFGGDIASIKSSPEKPNYKIGTSEVNCYGVEGNLALAHGPRREILYVNECNRKISYEVFDQLFSRSQITLVDFNPDQQFWLHEKIIPNFPHVLIKSNFLDNPYISEGELANILMKKDKPGFENWWRVYGEGELGTLEGAILQNWRYERPGEIDEALNYLPAGYALDYGFYPDPDAMVKVAIDARRKKIYVKELIYKNYNGTKALIDSIKAFYKEDERIIAESANPRTNSDLSEYFSITPVSKTKSVKDWLRYLQDFEIIIGLESHNLAKELQQYIWSDKKAGIPIDAFNHLIDAIRYYVMMQDSGGSILIFGET